MTEVLVALHYQNENCHPYGKIRLGMPKDAPWRGALIDAARRMMAGARAAGRPIVHVRLAVDPEYRNVAINTDLIRGWVEAGAWKEGSWGVEFLSGLGPKNGETVVTHARNSAFHGSTLEDALRGLGATQLTFAGVSTAYAVEGSVRHATDLGWPCTVIADACSMAAAEDHLAALKAMAPLARIANLEEWLGEAAP